MRARRKDPSGLVGRLSRRSTFAVAVTAIGMALTACGSVSVQDWTSAAEARCEEADALVGGIAVGQLPNSGDNVERMMHRYGEHLGTLADELDALDQPDELAAEAERVGTSVRAMSDLLLATGAGEGEDLPARIDAAANDAVAAAEELDLSCEVLTRHAGLRGTRSTPAQAECEIEWRTVRTAVEAYRASTGMEPADQAALVDEQFLRAESPNWEVVDGDVAPTPTGGCVGVGPGATADRVTTTTTFGGPGD